MLVNKSEKQQKQNRTSEVMSMAKLNIYRQAGLAGIAIVVTLVLVFAMTVAWYSNIIHTESMTFQAASWDFQFEGNIDIGSDVVSVAPGDSGYVAFELENTDDESITVDVNVSKDLLGATMAKRIYFYVDTGLLTDGEYMERVYVNKYDNYGYPVLANQSLILSETYRNAPALKWEWVYDVLGYYFMGSVTPLEGSESVTTVVNDYLRPVVYDYDEAAFDISDTGRLLSTDADTGVEEFIYDMFRTDGYEYENNYDITYDAKEAESVTLADGTVIPVYDSVNGYYPVKVDEQGNGIWMHLLDYTEIQTEMLQDTLLSEETKNSLESGETPSQYVARLILTGEPYIENVSAVTTVAQLETALNQGDVDRVKLNNDITLGIGQSITVNSANPVILDLNQYTLQVDASVDTFVVSQDNSFSLVNGTIKGTNTDTATVYDTVVKSTGASVTISNVTMEDVKTAVQVRDNGLGGSDSRIYIVDSVIKTTGDGIGIYGNGLESDRKMSLVIENSTIESGDYAIYANGTATGNGYWGTDIRITGSTIKGVETALYHPQPYSTATINSSTMIGETAIVVKGGTVNIEDGCLIQGTGPVAEGAHDNSGWTPTGAGIYVETSYQDRTMEVNVAGDNITVLSDNGQAVMMYEEGASHASIVITDGIYSSDVAAFLPEGYTRVQQADGRFFVGPQAASIETVQTSSEMAQTSSEAAQ